MSAKSFAIFKKSSNFAAQNPREYPPEDVDGPFVYRLGREIFIL